MRTYTVSICVLLLAMGMGLPAIAAGDVTLGLVVSDGVQDYIFEFPDSEEFMFVQFGGDDASFGILTDTSLFNDLCSVAAQSLFEGFQTTGVGLLDRGITFGGSGLLNQEFRTGETLASFSFSTSEGIMSERFEITDADLDGGYAFVQFLIDQVGGNLWIEILNGYLLEPEDPELKMISYSSDPAGGGGAVGDGLGSIVVEIQNTGNVPFIGEVRCAIGLSYATNWVPEWCTNYCEVCIQGVSLAPGEVGTYKVDIPMVPTQALEELRRREQIWTGYVDPDPGQDYVGVSLCMGKKQWCLFVPFSPLHEFTAMKKPRMQSRE